MEKNKFLPPQRQGGKSYEQYQETIKRAKDGEVVQLQMLSGAGVIVMDRRLFQGYGCTLTAEQIKGALVSAYCHEYNQEKVTDPVLMEVMTDEILKIMRSGFVEEVQV